MNGAAKFDVNMGTAIPICQRTKTVLFIINISVSMHARE